MVSSMCDVVKCVTSDLSGRKQRRDEHELELEVSFKIAV